MKDINLHFDKDKTAKYNQNAIFHTINAKKGLQ